MQNGMQINPSFVVLKFSQSDWVMYDVQVVLSTKEEFIAKIRETELGMSTEILGWVDFPIQPNESSDLTERTVHVFEIVAELCDHDSRVDGKGFKRVLEYSCSEVLKVFLRSQGLDFSE